MPKSVNIDSVTNYLAEPSEMVKGGLIVVHEVWGLTDHIKDVADRFASEGYMVLAPDLLSDTGINEKITPSMQEDMFNPEKRSAVQPKLREMMAPLSQPGFSQSTVEKLQACFNWLAKQPQTNGNVAITGFCFGGTYSFSLAIAEPKLRAAAPFYGHADQTVEELKNITCPVMAFYGENDERLIEPLPELKNKMKQANVNFSAEVYPDCGHAFFNDTNKYAYNEAAAKDAWQKVLAFLETNI
jgi:carboxymethylenebutenolidase